MHYLDKGWLVIALVLLEVATVALYESIVRHLRKKISDLKMERKRSQMMALQRNNVGRIRNALERFTHKLDPSEKHLMLHEYDNGVKVYDPNNRNLAIVRIIIDRQTECQEFPFEMKSDIRRDLNKTYCSPWSVDTLIEEAKEWITDYMTQVSAMV